MDRQEAAAFILDALVKDRNRSDLIMELCERTGGSWDQVQRLVQQVEFENRQKVAGSQSPLLVVIGALTIISGLSLAVCVAIFTLKRLSFPLLPIPVPYLGNLIYFVTGLAMMGAGILGVLRAGRTLLKGA